MTGHWWQRSAVETAAAINRRDVSALEVVETHIARMDEVNAHVNAVTMRMDKEARRAARAADDAMAAGAPVGPLHGVPVTIKENVDVAGQATTNGIPAFAENVASADSPVVAHLRKAGAIVIGRTNTPEFSFRWFTDNPLRGATLNPWNRDVTPGGSGGGGSASLAVGIGCIAHGNDVGGSLRYPAFACGVATVRPTLGRVPAFNPSAAAERPPMFQLMSVQGPMAREVRDVRLALEVMAARDPRDPWWVPAPVAPPLPDRKPRVAVTPDPGAMGVHPRQRDAVTTAADALATAGYDVVEAEPPRVGDAMRCWERQISTELTFFMEQDIRRHGGHAINRKLDFIRTNVPTLDLESYLAVLCERQTLLREWLLFLEDYHLVLGPVSTEPQFPVDEDLVSAARLDEIFVANRLLTTVNFLGLPAAGVPVGMADGLPLGVQIIGSRYREDMTLDAAEAIENATGILTPLDPR